MRKILSVFMLVALLAAGCKKDEVRAVVHAPAGITGFAATSNQVVLSSANDSTMVTSFSWQGVDYGASLPVTYTLLFDLPSDTSGAAGWANAYKVTIPTDSVRKSWLGTDLNHVANQLGLDPGEPGVIVVRLKSDVKQGSGAASAVPTLFADVVMHVTPYKVMLIYPKLYVAGDFLAPTWTQKEQPGWTLACVNHNGVFEGYVNFPNTDNNFKLSTQLDWNGFNYGWGTSGTTMSKTGGNLYFSGKKYCRVVADTNALTISYDVTQWRVAGDFNTWDLSATPMTFDPATNLWTATSVHMTAGDKFKFEGNTDWTFQFGVDAKGNLAFSGGDIIASKTGTFTVTLDLSQGAGNYTFSVK